MLRTFCRRFLPRPEDADDEEPVVFEEDFVEGVPATEYFPHHQMVLMDYVPVEDPNLEIRVGEMDFWESSFQAGTSITSTFLSWSCDTCDRINHRFTAHDILLADGETRHVHCNQDPIFNGGSGGSQYWRNADSRPILLDLHFRLRCRSAPAGAAGEEDRLLGSLWLRFLIRPCRSCRTDHWYTIQARSVDAQAQFVHYCYDDPLNDGVTVAGYYRPHNAQANHDNAQAQENVATAAAQGNAQDHDAVAAQENVDVSAQENAQVDDNAAQENAQDDDHSDDSDATNASSVVTGPC